jgi:hypothetical protein
LSVALLRRPLDRPRQIGQIPVAAPAGGASRCNPAVTRCQRIAMNLHFAEQQIAYKGKIAFSVRSYATALSFRRVKLRARVRTLSEQPFI